MNFPVDTSISVKFWTFGLGVFGLSLLFSNPLFCCKCFSFSIDRNKQLRLEESIQRKFESINIANFKNLSPLKAVWTYSKLTTKIISLMGSLKSWKLADPWFVSWLRDKIYIKKNDHILKSKIQKFGITSIANELELFQNTRISK